MNWEKLYLLEFAASFLGGTVIFVPIDCRLSKGCSEVPILFVETPICFSKFLKTIQEPGEKEKLSAALEYVLLVQRNLFECS